MLGFKDFLNGDIAVFCNAGGRKDQYTKFLGKKDIPVFSRAGGPPEQNNESIEENLNPRINPEYVRTNSNTLFDPEKDNKGLGEEYNHPRNIGIPDHHGTGGTFSRYNDEQAKNARTLSQQTNNDDDYHRIITPYTENSFNLNNTLFQHHINQTTPPRHIRSNSEEDSEIDTHHLDHLISSHNLPKDMTVYSGLHFHPNEHKGRIYFHPAYMSTSLSPHVAKDFGKEMTISHHDGNEYKEHKVKNIVRLHLEKGQKHLFTDNGSLFSGQGELILPRGTRFQLGQKPTHIIQGNFDSHFGDGKVGDTQYHIWNGRILSK